MPFVSRPTCTPSLYEKLLRTGLLRVKPQGLANPNWFSAPNLERNWQLFFLEMIQGREGSTLRGEKNLKLLKTNGIESFFQALTENWKIRNGKDVFSEPYFKGHLKQYWLYWDKILQLL